MARGMVLAAATLVVALAAGVAFAQPKEPDWPCVQRKVLHLSIGQMWSGPVPPDLGAWRADPEIAALAARLAARRTRLDDVGALLADLGEKGVAGRADRLALVFAGAFALIDAERTRIVEGIGRYARRQQALSARIEAAQDALAEAEAAAKPEDFDAQDRLDEMRDTLAWDTRIYVERNRSLTYVCESPVLLEQRAFALARAVEAAIASGG